MNPVRLAAVRYLNTVPLIEGLEKLAGLELRLAAPADIADLIASERVDVGLASVVDALRSRVPLALLPVGMIGCDGPTLTVRVFSRVPLERITRLHADTESHTSVALARLILERVWGVRPAVEPFRAPTVAPDLDEATWPESVLLIGDKVVRSAPNSTEFPHQLDLGEAWRDWTGLPFVYAVWMCRADAVESPRVRLIGRILDRQRRRNGERLAWVVRARSGDHGWPQDSAARYLGDLLRYDVDAGARTGVERFAAELGRLDPSCRSSVAWAPWPPREQGVPSPVGACPPR